MGNNFEIRPSDEPCYTLLKLCVAPLSLWPPPLILASVLLYLQSPKCCFYLLSDNLSFSSQNLLHCGLIPTICFYSYRVLKIKEFYLIILASPFYTPPQTKFRGVYRNHTVRLSVRLFTSCPGHNVETTCPIWIISHTIIVHDPRCVSGPWPNVISLMSRSPVRTRGVKSRMCPPYTQRVVKGD